ncbi:hypothetical protein [Pseudomonas kitaguniensis]|nr:hypothetical protein [Pseudomonas kitaguniensis]
MDISAIGKMLAMAGGQAKLDQGGDEGAEKQGAEKQDKQDPLKMLMDMLSKASGGAKGGGSEGSGGSEGQMNPEALEKMMGGRQGMEAMMPGDDNNRKVEA